jgi:uncharacterized membrane protein YfcA
MSPAAEFRLLFLAGLVAGGVNAIAGGGTILTFGVLGTILPPGPGQLVSANVTSTVGLWPGSAAAAWASRGVHAEQPAWARWLALPSIVGAAIGVGLLGWLPKESFDAVVPWLILLAAVLFALQPQAARMFAARNPTSHDTAHAVSPGRMAVTGLLQLLVAAYGGYFGAGIGILMLAVLPLLGPGDIHALNAVKNFLATVINGVAAALFTVAAIGGWFEVSWPHVAVLAVGAVAGGVAVVHLARRLSPRIVRRVVSLIAFALAGYYFWREWSHQPPPVPEVACSSSPTASRSATAGSPRSTAARWRSPAARSSACSAPTAPARRHSCG